jgi:hypothetical protein
MNPKDVPLEDPQGATFSHAARKARDGWETIASVPVAHLLDAQGSLEALRRTLRSLHGAEVSYDIACQGVSLALVALEECGMEYELAQDARHCTRRYETSETPAKSAGVWPANSESAT